MAIWLTFAAVPILIILGLGYVVFAATQKSKTHPSSLNSAGRQLTRNLRESVESLERLVNSKSGSAEANVIGPEALSAAKKILEEVTVYAQVREELLPQMRRENGQGRATEAVKSIDLKIAEAETVVGELVSRVATGKLSTDFMENEDSFDSLVKRLESLSKSMDESRETLGVEER